MKNKKTDLQLEKNKIRQEILKTRNNLSTEEVEKKSDLIIQNLEKFIKNAENIMIFMDMKNEVRITKLMELYPEKSFFIPKITDSKNREMKINKYEENELVLHKFGYYESSSSDFYNENILDIVIVPAVVFDLEKNRIGFGGGYYDTFLKKVRRGNKKAIFIGVCYDFQVVDKIPREEHDIIVDFVVNENKFFE
ncbi:5-formyltetrahydrofolate cyclo-ligase [Leptotrichia trevisanii]|uniref:5-formyltetrahydrofolate cyclo-ligase n=1 Tax=Leptotrichia trevisanii TaxID=109328 RepID=UPI0026F0BB01|nr:5-formyltetrahydrofolate cyclo-ligase [Leptotrichia trevisanii]